MFASQGLPYAVDAYTREQTIIVPARAALRGIDPDDQVRCKVSCGAVQTAQRGCAMFDDGCSRKQVDSGFARDLQIETNIGVAP